MPRLAMSWWKKLKGKIKLKEPLKKHTTLKIGGPAKLFIEPRDPEDLRHLLILLKRYRLPSLVIGAGSNILVSDRGVSTVVLRLNAPFFKNMNFNGRHLEAGGGASLNQVVLDCAKQGLSGAEFLIGIPGTVGGAIIMNAGQAKGGKGIGDLIEDVTVIDYSGKVKKLNKAKIRFGYRGSNLSRYIILSARLRLTKKNRKKITQDMHKYILVRKKSQDYRYPSAGCIFKNPAGDSAGRLIELCGLKGRRIGAASVSLRHANFIINKGKARADDVLKLMGLVKKEVKDKFKIDLKPEVEIWA